MMRRKRPPTSSKEFAEFAVIVGLIATSYSMTFVSIRAVQYAWLCAVFLLWQYATWMAIYRWIRPAANPDESPGS